MGKKLDQFIFIMIYDYKMGFRLQLVQQRNPHMGIAAREEDDSRRILKIIQTFILSVDTYNVEFLSYT